MTIYKNTHQEIGDMGEALFKTEIRKRFGLQAQATPHSHPFDFIVSEKKVEVKTSTYSDNGYQANLRGHNDQDFDVLVIILLSDDPPIWLVIPAKKITQTKITIRNKQAEGKFSSYRGSWSVLEQAIGAK
jgi:hypothetical protein